MLLRLMQTDKEIHHIQSPESNKYYSDELNYSDNSCCASLDETKIY